MDAAFYWEGSLPIPKVIIGTDSHCISYVQQRKDSDLFIGMHYNYLESGDVWIPYAYSPTDHFYIDVVKDHFITHIGVEYAERKQLLDYLQSRWKVSRGLGILYGEGSLIYSAGDLALCLPSELDLATRFWEAMAYKNVPLQKRVPDLNHIQDLNFEPLVEDKHYIGFNNHDELIEKIVFLEKNPEIIYNIQNAAYKYVKKHTWQSRAEMVINNLK